MGGGWQIHGSVFIFVCFDFQAASHDVSRQVCESASAENNTGLTEQQSQNNKGTCKIPFILLIGTFRTSREQLNLGIG